MRDSDNEKWKNKNNGRNRTTKLRKNPNVRRKGKLQVFWNIGSGHNQTSRNGRKNKKRVSQTNENTSPNQTLHRESHQNSKHLDSPSCKILWTILNIDKRRTQRNRPKESKTKLMTMHKSLHSRDDIDYMCQEKEEEI